MRAGLRKTSTRLGDGKSALPCGTTGRNGATESPTLRAGLSEVRELGDYFKTFALSSSKVTDLGRSMASFQARLMTSCEAMPSVRDTPNITV